uniref:NADH-ubiquinone oxidoreductase chain 4L n=1 Tax=Neoperla panafricana TaxID=3047058 RepID=A0AA95ZBH9_9NEOP|nr:NADH dehydrogenase subunit 4L [Neoperla panafricana]WNH42485.1 NADH dehydrogenase subunit 4L [Neoperla panafricana]WNH42487.1 NADH dehydrogenase subunit 4L [Neoperla panafricana]
MLSSFFWGFPLIMFACGSWVFVSKRKHLLLTLLSLESMVLSLFMFLFIFLSFMHYELFFSMVFLTFSVCEGALGLSILVSMIRTHGNDYFQTFSVLQC